MNRLMVLGVLLVSICTGMYSQTMEETLEVHVTPGPEWTGRIWYGLIPVKKTPQFAFWIETVDGMHVTTMTVTARTGTKEWRGNPEGGRPDSLPVWSGKVVASASSYDAATSATPVGDIALKSDTSLLKKGEVYIARFEVNTSFDYNKTWPKNAKKGSSSWSGVNGQPSIVYEARFTVGQKATIVLEPVGTGSVTGENGVVRKGLEGIDSALSLVKSVTLSIK